MAISSTVPSGSTGSSWGGAVNHWRIIRPCKTRHEHVLVGSVDHPGQASSLCAATARRRLRVPASTIHSQPAASTTIDVGKFCPANGRSSGVSNPTVESGAASWLLHGLPPALGQSTTPTRLPGTPDVSLPPWRWQQSASLLPRSRQRKPPNSLKSE